MPQEPKKRHSRARQGKRRSNINLDVPNTSHKMNKYKQMIQESTVVPEVKKQEETDDE